MSNNDKTILYHYDEIREEAFSRETDEHIIEEMRIISSLYQSIPKEKVSQKLSDKIKLQGQLYLKKRKQHSFIKVAGAIAAIFLFVCFFVFFIGGTKQSKEGDVEPEFSWKEFHINGEVLVLERKIKSLQKRMELFRKRKRRKYSSHSLQKRISQLKRRVHKVDFKF